MELLLIKDDSIIQGKTHSKNVILFVHLLLLTASVVSL